MKLSSALVLWTLLSSALFAVAAPTPGQDRDDNDRGSKTSLRGMEGKYKRYIRETLEKRDRKDKCNSKTVTIRREWYGSPDFANPTPKNTR